MRGGLRGAEFDIDVAGVVLAEPEGDGVAFSEASGLVSSCWLGSGDNSVSASKSASIFYVQFPNMLLGEADCFLIVDWDYWYCTPKGCISFEMSLDVGRKDSESGKSLWGSAGLCSCV